MGHTIKCTSSLSFITIWPNYNYILRSIQQDENVTDYHCWDICVPCVSPDQTDKDKWVHYQKVQQRARVPLHLQGKLRQGLKSRSNLKTAQNLAMKNICINFLTETESGRNGEWSQRHSLIQHVKMLDCEIKQRLHKSLTSITNHNLI